MEPIKRVYVAGPLTPRGIKNSNPAIEYLMNVRDMLRIGVELIQHGYSPFIPCMDMLIFLSLSPGENISEGQIKDYSMDWVMVSDAILLTPDWVTSSGTLKEVETAIQNGIPIFGSIDDLIMKREIPMMEILDALH